MTIRACEGEATEVSVGTNQFDELQPLASDLDVALAPSRILALA